jgi:hypothetical protein
MSNIILRSVCVLGLASLAAAPLQSPPYTVAFSTYFGGSDYEQIRDVTTDAAGNVYITGGTASTNFPTTAGAYQRTHKGWFDVFVVKFSPSGQLVWSTLLGGPNYDRAYGIEVDNQGYVYLSGRSGPGFPTTAGTLQPTYQGHYTGTAYGDQNAFIAKLKPDGSGLVWSTHFGTGGMNRDFDINRATGEIWVASTYEPSLGQQPFPSAWFASGYRKTPVGGNDNVVAKIKADGTQVLWATFIGGTGDESGKNSLRVDSAGNVLLLTDTTSTNAPVMNAAQSTRHGPQDSYLVKIRADGAALLFATYFGGSDIEWCETHHLAVDGSNNVFISGITHSTDLPTTTGAFQRTFGGINGQTNFHATGDGYVAKFSPTGQLLASTYFGGRYGDCAQGLACDSAGNVYFCGGTVSDNLPATSDAIQSSFRGVEDFMAVKMSPDLTQLLFCTYIGSTVYDEGRVCWADGNGTFYVAGECSGTNWPVVNAAQPAYGGGPMDNVLVKFTASTVSTPAAPAGLAATTVSSSRIDLAWTDGSSNETGFKIERKTGSGTFAQIATVGANVTTYSSTGLSAGTSYSYRVRATNSGGDSAYSNTASASTLATGPDGDGDGLPDAWEMQHFGNLAQTGSGDPDADGLTNAQEFAAGTDPTDNDTDHDGMKDGAEVLNGFDPLVSDEDGNGIPDGQDDWDGDGTPNATDATPGTIPAPPPPTGVGGGGGNGGGCGLTGLEGLLLLLLGRRFRRTL